MPPSCVDKSKSLNLLCGDNTATRPRPDLDPILGPLAGSGNDRRPHIVTRLLSTHGFCIGPTARAQLVIGTQLLVAARLHSVIVLAGTILVPHDLLARSSHQHNRGCPQHIARERAPGAAKSESGC